MTGTHWLMWLIAGPIVGVAIAAFSGGVRPLPIILAALIGEAVAFTSARVWSDHVTQRALSGGGNVMIARADVSLAGRMFGIGALIAIALCVAGLTLLLARIARRH